MTTTMEQVVTQLQQELYSFRVQIAAQTGLAEAVRAINNLAAAQIRKETPILIDVNDLVVRRNSLARKRISISGRRRRKHFSLE